MKKFFAEFKTFITRGNVVDMAIGVIVGSAFTAIVNGMSNNILKPLINAVLYKILGADSLSKIHTILIPEYLIDETTGEFLFNPETGERLLDLTKSIYIDWGSFINAVINFFIIAFVLFIIVKFVNKFREEHDEMTDRIKSNKFTREQKKELRANGISPNNIKAGKAYFAEKQRIADEKAAQEAKIAEEAAKEAARLEREANPTTEDLLKLILVELKKNN